MKIWPGQTEDFKPPLMSPKGKGNLSLGLSGLFFVEAATSYLSPPSAPATGRWAWLHNIFSSQFGASGDFVLYSVAGCVFLLVALKHYSAHSSQKGQH
jgi:hypothetical protein